MDFVRLIQEGRVDDFKSKYSQKFGNNVNNIVSKVPHKFLDWVGKKKNSFFSKIFKNSFLKPKLIIRK